MEQLMYEDPVAYWATGYFLFSTLVLVTFGKDYDVMPWRLPVLYWVAALLWPITLACMLGLLLVLAVHAGWCKLTNKENA